MPPAGFEPTIADPRFKPRDRWNRRAQTHLLTYPCSTVLLEKLTGSQLVKKFPAFYKTRRFIAAFTSPKPPVHILSQINPFHVTHPTS